MFIGFEGPDGSGKTTLSAKVGKALNATIVASPGSTHLGKLLRPIITKTAPDSENVKFCPLSRQFLYMSDYTNFISQTLIPALNNNETIVADRISTIGLIVYGILEEIPIHKIANLLQIISPPKLDRLYFILPTEKQLLERLTNRGNLDHFDKRAVNILKIYNSVLNNYNKLISISVDLQNIVILPEGDPDYLLQYVLRDLNNYQNRITT